MSNKKKFSIRVFLTIFLIGICVCGFCIKGLTYYTVDGKFEDVAINEYVHEVSGYELRDDVYVVNNEDPQIIFDFSDSNLYGLKIEFANAIDASSVQIYYGRNDMSFSEIDSQYFGSGQTNTIEVIDAKGFEYLRLDIDEDFEFESTQVTYQLDYTKVSYPHIFLVCLVLITFIAVLLALNSKVDNAFAKLIQQIKKIGFYILKNKNCIWKDIVVVLLFGVGACGIEWLYAKFTESSTLNEFRAIWIFVVLLIIYFTCKYRKKIYKYAHIYFFIILMLIGTTQTISTPTVVGISWDDQIHYGGAAYLSWGATGQISNADNALINSCVNGGLPKQEYEEANQIIWKSNINDIDSGYRTLVSTTNYSPTAPYIAYIPSALALMLGRGLGLSFTANFIFGKWINLLVYAIVLSYSIYILKRGKLVVAAIGLIPTNVFLATAYAYDWWVTCFVILGYSMFASTLQSQKKLGTKRMLLILAIMIIGILPKAIYFPLIFPMMLLNKERYENPKIQRVLVGFAMVFLVATFILPMITGGAGTGDWRGGSDVNATEQIKFILTEPFEYARILIQFLIEYLSLDASYMYLTFFSYMGQAKYYTICICAIMLACVIDNNNIEGGNKGEERRVKAGTLLGTAGSIVLAATALYIDFTPVQYETILGCQHRYIIPVLFPLLFMFSKIKINVPDKVKENTFAIITVTLGMVCLLGMYNLSISNY